jgi:hypothetical protein
MWKKEGKIDDKKRGQTNQYSGRGDVDRNGPYTGVTMRIFSFPCVCLSVCVSVSGASVLVCVCAGECVDFFL